MRQQILLTPHNKKILVEKYGMTLEQFTDEYWILRVVTSESEMNLVFKNKSTKDIQIKIRTRARKLRKKFINELLGLPGKSGSIEKQRRWHRQFKKTGLTSPNT